MKIFAEKLLTPSYFTYVEDETPLAPDSVTAAGGYHFAWMTAFDVGVDVHFDPIPKAYIGAISVKFSAPAVSGVEVLVDGKTAGCYFGESGYRVGSVAGENTNLIEKAEITVPVGAYGSEILLRLHGAMQAMDIEKIELLGASLDDEPTLWPAPKKVTFLGENRRIAAVSAKGGAEADFAAEFFKQTLAECSPLPLCDCGITVCFEETKDPAYEGERYTIDYKDGTLTVTAAERLTLLFGADTLRQALNAEGIALLSVDDKPTCAFRGFHLGLPHLDYFEFAERFFRYVLLPLRYNSIIVEFAGGMRFDKHPEILEAWLEDQRLREAGEIIAAPIHNEMGARGTVLEKADVARYLASARKYGLDVIPEVQSLSHVQYLTAAHPEFGEYAAAPAKEIDTRGEDERPAETVAHCYCPSCDGVYEVMFDIIDEIVEVAKPKKYVHLGHDEVYQLGVCEKCKTKTPAELYYSDLMKLYGHLKEKGLTAMIWSDMLHPAPLTQYKCESLRERLPKDIVYLEFIWYFKFDTDIEDDLLPYGNPLMLGNLYSSHFTRYRSRMMKPGVIGGECSTWVAVGEEEFGDNGKIFDVAYLSEMLWNPENYEEKNRRAYTELIARHVLPYLRCGLHGAFAPRGYEKKALTLSGKKPALPAVLSEARPEAILAENFSFDGSATCDRLLLELTLLHPMRRIVWKDLPHLGSYTVTYEDGTQSEIELRYGRNVMELCHTYGIPKPTQYFRHNGYVGTYFSDPKVIGKTDCGEDLTLLVYPWDNPFPEKKITKIAYKAVNENVHPILTNAEILTKTK